MTKAPSFRARTISIKHTPRAELNRLRLLSKEPMHWRPTVRYQCEKRGKGDGRVCPYVSCKYHLYLDVNEITGAMKLNFPDMEVWEMKEFCVLDIAEEGGQSLEEVGNSLNVTRERIRQIELIAVRQLRRRAWWLKDDVQ